MVYFVCKKQLTKHELCIFLLNNSMYLVFVVSIYIQFMSLTTKKVGIPNFFCSRVLTQVLAAFAALLIQIIVLTDEDSFC